MEEPIRYENYEEITQLGKGNVWLVLDKESKKVFIKKYRIDFKPEVYESISHIQDPHIPKIVQCCEKEGVLYLIEEYIAGETLLEKMEQGYVFAEQEIIGIMVQLCEALECLHIRFKPIIHRDIKPSNIMISNDGIVKLIDYNGARRYEKGAAQDTDYIGTPGYAAPEQYGFSQSDARTDIYGMGILLNYLLTGCHPTEKAAGGELGKIVRKCIQIDPDQRYNSVESVKLELQKLTGKAEEEKYSLWPIPGFRTKKVWKMIVAVLGYGVIGNYAFAIGKNIARAFRRTLPFPMVLYTVWAAIMLLFLVALATDYAGIARRFPMVRSKNLMIHWGGCILWGILEFAAAVGILGMIETIIKYW